MLAIGFSHVSLRKYFFNWFSILLTKDMSKSTLFHKASSFRFVFEYDFMEICMEWVQGRDFSTREEA